MSMSTQPQHHAPQPEITRATEALDSEEEDRSLLNGGTSTSFAYNIGTFEEPHRTPFFFILIFIILPAAFGLVYYGLSIHHPSAARASPSASNSTRPLVAPTILISIDGFRHDYLKRKARTPTVHGSRPLLAPNLNRLATNGVWAQDGMQPVMPSKTFPNHWSIVTGLYAESHGIIGNVMFNPTTKRWFHPQTHDPHWWHGEPIWYTLRNSPRVMLHPNGTRFNLSTNYTTATVFWVGSEVKKHSADVMWPYDKTISYDRRVNRVVELLKGHAPDLGRPAQFVTLYFDTVDRAGHVHGPDSTEVDTEISRVDASIEQLVEKLGPNATDTYNFIIVSDHGMTGVSKQRTVDFTPFIKQGSVQDEVSSPLGMWLNVTVSAEQIYGELYAKTKAMGAKVDVYLKKNIPERWHIARSPLLTQVVTMAKLGWTVRYPHQSLVPGANGVPSRMAAPSSTLMSNPDYLGQHGFDNEEADMQASFIASGPAFRKGGVVKGLRCVDIYTMLCHMYSAVPAPNNGSLQISLNSILRPS